MFYLAQYATGTDIRFPLVKRGVVDLAATADFTPATGDTKVSKDGGSFANATNNPAAVAGTGSVGWKHTLTATELTCAELNYQIVDSATKAVEDQYITVYTYGNASAKLPVNFADLVRFGLTALPNANAEAAGGLFTRGSGAGQINQQANGQIDSNLARWLNTAAATPNTAGVPLIDVARWLGTVPTVNVAGVPKVDMTTLDGSATNAQKLAAIAAQAIFATVDTTAFASIATEFEVGDYTEATAQHIRGKTVCARSGALLLATGQVVTAYSLSGGGRGHITTSGSPTGEVFANGVTLLFV